MRQLFFALLFAVVIGGVFVATQDKATFKAAQGFMPDVIRVAAQMPDKGRICVEVPGGIDACRSISELRLWITERKGR
jgi:hypothetical protein